MCVFDVVKFNVIYLLCYFFFQFVLFSLFDDMFNLPFSFQFVNVFDVISVSFLFFVKFANVFDFLFVIFMILLFVKIYKSV